MTAHEILTELVRIAPAFRSRWESEENLFRDDDGSFTSCGVFSEFTGFFRQQHLTMKKEGLEAVAALIARCECDEFSIDAAYTCFLENVAGDPPDESLAPYLSPSALQFMVHWRPSR
jgi:hypothetical protein